MARVILACPSFLKLMSVRDVAPIAVFVYSSVRRETTWFPTEKGSERSRVKTITFLGNDPARRIKMFAKLISPCMKNSLSKVMCNNDDSRCYNNNISFILESELRFVRKGGGGRRNRVVVIRKLIRSIKRVHMQLALGTTLNIFSQPLERINIAGSNETDKSRRRFM